VTIVQFDFRPMYGGEQWNMGNSSDNPAPQTWKIIYIIHNSNTNNTYVGYADDARDRWKTRAEAFHTMGISASYGRGVLCACCIPTKPHSIALKGRNGCEHLLIRAVCKGLLGRTTNTNTQLAGTYFTNQSVTELRVYLPADPWGSLSGTKSEDLSRYQGGY
jgi:hypothetical protein